MANKYTCSECNKRRNAEKFSNDQLMFHVKEKKCLYLYCAGILCETCLQEACICNNKNQHIAKQQRERRTKKCYKVITKSLSPRVSSFVGKFNQMQIRGVQYVKTKRLLTPEDCQSIKNLGSEEK